MAMTFSEFTRKYKDTINPITSKPWTLEEIMTSSGLSESQMREFVEFWEAFQKVIVASKNKIPSVEEIILAHDGPPVVIPEPPKPVIPPMDRTKLPRTPWNPTGTIRISDLSVPQFEDLMVHILTEHFGK
jgi:hypothetical protein